MPEEASFQPVQVDYVSAFKSLMESRRVEAAVIDDFIALWWSLPPNSSRMPCPLCYAAGGWGNLGPIEERSRALQVKCARCKTEIRLGQIGGERRSKRREEPASRKPPKTGNVRWELLFSNGPGAGAWSWRLLRIDGSIEQMSEGKPTFGMAVRDAMQNGFSPKRDFWAIKRQDWITAFHEGRIISSGPNDELIQTQPSGEPSVESLEALTRDAQETEPPGQ
jgi:hypothetical protein